MFGQGPGGILVPRGILFRRIYAHPQKGRLVDSPVIGKDVLLTGASGAIGSAIARRLASAGYTLHLTSRSKERLKPLAQELFSKTRITLYELDLSRLESCRRIVQKFFKQAGEPYGLVCNAGDLGALGAFLDLDFDHWMKSLRQNFLGHAAMIHAFGKAFAAKRLKSGAIVILSGAGLGSGVKHTHLSSYGAAKAALTYLSEALAPEFLEHGLTVNAVAPGQVKSGLTESAVKAGVARAGAYARYAEKCMADGGVSPDLAAQLVEFLMSPSARTISGRLLSARFDQAALREKTEVISQDADWYRLRRIDYELYQPKRS
jgi:NAD(P)-dependent dehydrogenase (short-subunit alcohol dehydrogenase family)